MSLMHPDERPAGPHAFAISGWGYVAKEFGYTTRRRLFVALVVLRENVALSWREIGEILKISPGHASRLYREARRRLAHWARGESAGEDESASKVWREFKGLHGGFAAAVFALVVECEFSLSEVAALIGVNRGSMSRIWERLRADVASHHQLLAAA